MTSPDALPVLYSFRRCPYAMRSRMALQISGVQVRLREILLRDKPDEMLSKSAKGTVPVLVQGQRVIDESLDVMRWALEQHDPENWLSYSDSDIDLVAENDGPFKHHLDRYKYATRYEDSDPVLHRTEGEKFFAQLEARMQNHSYLAGAQRGFTDIAIFPFVRQFRIADEAWFDAAPYPNVQKWVQSLLSSELFSSIMKKYVLWKDTGTEHLFPDTTAH